MKRSKLYLLWIFLIGLALNVNAQNWLTNDAYAVINDNCIEVICDSPTSAIKKESLTITVLNNKGKDLAHFICTCDKFSSLSKFSGEIIDKNGKVIKKIKKTDLEVSEYSSGLSSDDYRYYYECYLPYFPITIKYEWEIKYKDGLIGFPTFIPQNQYHIAVEKASYSLLTPSGVDCRYRVKNSDTEVKQKQQANGTLLSEVSVSNLPALIREYYGTSFQERIPVIHFAPTKFTFDGIPGNIGSWNDYGKWQYELLKGRDQLPEILKTKLHEMTADCETDRDKVKVLYNYLGANTRYVSIQLGIGGLQPAPASEVHRTGFGDCKALSNYMKAMLAELNIPSNYTVISTVNRDLMKDYSSANQMNHVILQVPLQNDTLWLECTDPNLPFGYIHNGIAGHEALLVNEQGGQIVRLPVYQDIMNMQNKTASVILSQDGQAKIEASEQSHLFQYEDARSFIKLERAKQTDLLRRNINLRDAEIKDIKVLENKENHPSIDINYTVNTSQYGNKTGNRLFIPVNIFRSSFSMPVTENRQQDIHINYGYQDTDKVSIHLPEGFIIESIPKPVSIESEFGKFTCEMLLEDNIIYITHQLLMKRGVYSKELYDELIAFNKILSGQYAATIVVKKG